MQKLAKDIYIESGFPGVTVGAVVTAQGLICIDTPTQPADARRWRLKLQQLTDLPVRFILSLDHHRDRVMSHQWFEAPVIAHETAAEQLRAQPELYKANAAEADAEPGDLAALRLVPPQLTFTERMELHSGGHVFHLIHRPGVSPGAIWVELPAEQIVFTGDALAADEPPPLQSADLETWLAQLAELRKARYPARVIVPGRGAPLDKAGVRATEDFLKLARRKLEALQRRGKPRAEAGALAEGLLAGFRFSAAQREAQMRRLRQGLEQLYDRLAEAE
jgi:glyoxylase-like metal-dependent hydrolase (beta-lactamase superfamily II)